MRASNMNLAAKKRITNFIENQMPSFDQKKKGITLQRKGTLTNVSKFASKLNISPFPSQVETLGAEGSLQGSGRG